MAATVTVAGLAREWVEQFETKERHDGSKFLTTKGDDPEAQPLALVHACHEGLLPHDRVFDAVHSILSTLAGYDDPGEDDVHEIADGLVDVYTHDRYAWAQDMHSVIDPDRVDELGGGESTGDPAELIGRAQYAFYYDATAAALEALREAAGDDD